MPLNGPGLVLHLYNSDVKSQQIYPCRSGKDALPSATHTPTSGSLEDALKTVRAASRLNLKKKKKKTVLQYLKAGI